ncbi:MAG: hypothetical protein LQ351_005051 [Letrouitia transgressa]|nr:MAG: hypothetical protein LQ351_005051 [Letrouitia transgressa]
MLEAEFQTQKLGEIMGVVEDSIKSLVNNLRGSTVEEELITAVRKSDELEAANLSKSNTTLQRRWDGLERQSWPRISYEDAICLLKDAADNNATQFDHQPSWSTGLHSEHERFIATEVGHGSPVFVTNYPETIKPFYMLPSNMDLTHGSSVSQTVECFDLLFPDIGEVAGGSLREHRLVNLLQSMHRHGVNHSSQNLKTGELDRPAQSNEPGPLDWYVDLRRYGSIPHGGFGVGFDRLLCYLSGRRNIRDVIPWPRYFGRCDC